MSFTHRQVKYFAPFFKDEEFSIKPKFFENQSATLLDILSSMFRRKLLDDDPTESRQYWRRIIQDERRVSVLLIFNDKLYRQYPNHLAKPTKHSGTDSFVTISKADTVIPKDLLAYFWPKDLSDVVDDNLTEDDRLTGVRLKIRISGEHIHPRSVVVPYEPTIIFEDEHLVAVNKPFGIPSMGETNDLSSPNEWNSILTWCRSSSKPNKEDKPKGFKKKGTVCDLMNRLDLDVSGLVLLGKGAYRKKRGFAGHSANRDPSKKTVKVYLAIVPFQEKAIRITTPRLGFDRRQAKAVIKEPAQSSGDGSVPTSCKTSIYPLLKLEDGDHSLVAICLEESGQRHQIRFHLSLVGATIPNDHLYRSPCATTGSKVRTGVGSSIPTPSKAVDTNGIPHKEEIPNNPLVQVQRISEQDENQFLDTYVYTNGVTGFQKTRTHVNEHIYSESLIRRSLYPFEDEGFSERLDRVFTKCPYCGKCKALEDPCKDSSNEEEGCIGDDGDEEPSQTLLSHGIYLHSWRYFYPTDEYPLLDADLPESVTNNNDDDTRARWWPVEILGGKMTDRD